MPKYSFPTNPDPEIGNVFTEGIAGTISLLKGTGRTRYDILKELNASPEQQKEMRQLIAAIFLNGILIGIAVSAFGLVTYLIVQQVI